MHVVPPTQLVQAAFDSVTATMCRAWIDRGYQCTISCIHVTEIS